MAVSIASAIIASLKTFNSFTEQARSLTLHQAEILNAEKWNDELGRLRIWAANIGAHKTGQSSLDFRLRDASHIRDQIIKLLNSVDDSIRMARELLDEDPDNDEDGSPNSDDDSTNDDAASIMLEIRSRVAAIIKSLFQMSMLVRKPAQHDFRLGASRAEVEAYGPYDISHIREKFPKANEVLVKRLAAATRQRRMYLKYRERHAAKLKQDLPRIMGEKATTLLSDTTVTDAEKWNIDFGERASISGESQTSYAATLMDGADITIPSAPKESRGGQPFECPICYYIIKVESANSWNKHVFFDLQPYVCLDMECKEPQKIYATRREWIRHAKAGLEQGTLGISDHEVEICPLCTESFRNGVEYDGHCARHLQDLALFVLPPSLNDVDEKSDSNSSHNLSKTNRSSDGSIAAESIHDDIVEQQEEEKKKHFDPTRLDSPQEDEEDYEIKCICGYNIDDGNTVYCERCNTWQHIECYYFSSYRDGMAPDIGDIEHFCTDCSPRQYDKKAAMARQKARFALEKRPLIESDSGIEE
ncbi:MAG: hypothetical protein HETSPECPRED_008748 [Heterodermia speciosa]|uniref:Zinc finger PHD-type domain-containing protein n=1 Tax=Heterodermia speciosa TaxID=116794 RepID=A0A8H3FZ61_9LECA|nr:MAG: hypothetical protein HETSPECPRED_008748 [Heterodermia speciosa]